MIPRRYFDWAATAMPLSPQESLPADIPWGNPSSLHEEGRAAKASLEDSRRRCALALGAQEGQIFFTSGGSESNAIVLYSLLNRAQNASNETVLLYSAAEHPSIRESALALSRLGVKCAALPVDENGLPVPGSADKYPAAKMAALMSVNNETGTINDMQKTVSALREKRKKNGERPIHIHCDLVQAVGKIPLNVQDWDIDSAAISAHKIGGPRGIGLLYLRKCLDALVRGGGQEGGIRSGTENTAGAAMMASCLEKRCSLLGADASNPASPAAAARRMEILIGRLRSEIKGFSTIPVSRMEAPAENFSPWILQCAFGIPGEVMVRALDEAGFAVSTGSACSGKKGRPVLEAMGLSRDLILGGIRISQGWTTTADDIEALADTLGELCRKL